MQLIDGYIFYAISTWPSSIKEMLKYMYTFFINTHSKTKKDKNQIQ